MRPKTMMAAVFCLMVAGLLFGAETRVNKRLVIISPHWEGIRREFAQAFEDSCRDKMTGNVEVEWLEVGASSNILMYIRSEFASHPEGIGVDLVWGGGGIYYRALQEDGLLEPQELDPEILSAVPAELAGSQLYDPQYHWFGTAISSFGILYNKEVLKILDLPEPSSWKDLADPAYFEWLVLADPRHSGTSHALFEIMLQAYGWDQGFSVITRSFANAKTITKASSQIPALVATGEAALGPAIDFYAWSKMAELGGDRLGFVIPLKETVINIDPVAVLKGAPHPQLARAFIEFVLSKKGQKLWMLPPEDPEGTQRFTLSRLSVRPDIYSELKGRAVVKLNPFEMGAGLDFDDDLAAARWQTLNDLIGVAMIDAHGELSRAFWAVKDQDPKAPAFQRFVAPPDTQEVFAGRAENWGDPAFRNQVISSWAEFFLIKNQGVLRMAGAGGRSLLDSLANSLRYVLPVLILGLMLEVVARAAVQRARKTMRYISEKSGDEVKKS